MKYSIHKKGETKLGQKFEDVLGNFTNTDDAFDYLYSLYSEMKRQGVYDCQFKETSDVMATTLTTKDHNGFFTINYSIIEVGSLQ